MARMRRVAERVEDQEIESTEPIDAFGRQGAHVARIGELAEAEAERVIAEGIEAVAGAVAFVNGLPACLPRAICSSSSTPWIRAHLAHIGLADAFGDHLYSGREHVAHGKPAPDIYRFAADALGVPIEHCVVIEDSAVGAAGALA